MIGEYHIRRYGDPMEPSKGKVWGELTVSQGRDNGYIINWGCHRVRDITLYTKENIQRWIDTGNIIPKNHMTKKLIDKHAMI